MSDADLEALAAGQREAADALGTAVIGGNLSRGTELSITTTALGAAARPLTRAGARPGDAIWMAGPVGLAAAGLAALSRAEGPPAAEEGSAAVAAAVAAWRRPRARLAEGRRACGRARAAIDVSDGLARDVGHLARASGVRAVLDAARIVGDDLREAAAALGRDPLALALYGGEDYALVVTLPDGRRPRRLHADRGRGAAERRADASRSAAKTGRSRRWSSSASITSATREATARARLSTRSATPR